MMPLRTTDAQSIDFKQKFSLKDKVIFITGACGLIGKAFCEACAQAGAIVIIADIKKTDPIGMAQDYSQRYRKKFHGIELDVGSKENVIHAKETVLKRYGQINGLVNCHQNKTENFFEKFEDYTETNWDAVIETNLKGTFLTCQIIGSWMSENGGGVIVNLASAYSVVAPNQNLYKGTNMGCPAAYSASKGGVQALSQYLASYWASSNVRVNQITPHGVWNHHEPAFEQNFSNFSPMQRMSYNHEVAGALVFLLSDASSYVTGHNLVVDGGWSTW